MQNITGSLGQTDGGHPKSTIRRMFKPARIRHKILWGKRNGAGVGRGGGSLTTMTTRSSAGATAVRSPPTPLCLLFPHRTKLNGAFLPYMHMWTLHFAQMAFCALQWFQDIQILFEPQKCRPALTARCSDDKWTSHNEVGHCLSQTKGFKWCIQDFSRGGPAEF